MLDLIEDKHWQFVAENCGNFRSGATLSWPSLEASPVLDSIKRNGLDLAVLSDLLGASLADLLKHCDIRRDAHFMEIGNDANILFDGITRYLKSPGEYTLLHTDKNVLDWVRAKSIGSRLQVNLHHIDDVDATLTKTSALFEGVDFVYDTAQFTVSVDDLASPEREKIAKICAQILQMDKPVCSLLFLTEFLASIDAKRVSWTDDRFEPFGKTARYAQLELGGIRRLIIDQNILEQHADTAGWITQKIVPPVPDFPIGIAPEARCCKVLHVRK